MLPPPPRERFTPLFHCEERLQARCQLLATEFGNILEKWDGLSPPALGLGEKGFRRTVPLQVRNGPPELAGEILLDGAAPSTRPAPETLRPALITHLRSALLIHLLSLTYPSFIRIR